jgi:cysteinyl-tRNA synthetase
MPIQVHSTLTRRKDAFVPVVPGKVGMYLCGPTVYDDCHIGHLMGPVLFDAVARWFAARGFAVRFVNNITDIDDKIIARSQATGEPWQDITRRYTAQYAGLLAKLHVTSITDHPKCSDYVGQMVAYIADLVGKDRAYAVAGDGVYYDVQRQEGYGKLSGRRLDDMQAGARIERDGRLRHPADFALWKLAKPGEPSWPSPWGDGRPGWHIECSVMSLHTLGDTFDIHAGGEELKFPHHENEIAQGEAHGGGYARCWMHNNLVQFEGDKISKSDPRMKDPAFRDQFKALQVVGHFGGPAVRLLLLQGHYRRPVDFAPSAITASRTALARLLGQLGALAEEPAVASLPAIEARAVPAAAAKARAGFCAAMDDDFNTGAAIAQLFTLAGEAKHLAGAEQQACLAMLRDLGRLIGLFQPGDAAAIADQPAAGAAGDATLDQVMAVVLELRAKARAAKDFATSDLIRDRLKAAGIVIKDGKDGATWARG